MEKSNYIYRIQPQRNDINPFLKTHMPRKRVTVSPDGDITFNPDENNYVYFSKNSKHHCYYIYSKVLKIINDELAIANQNPLYDKLDLPSNLGGLLPGRFSSLKHYSNMNLSVIRNVQNFFKNYLPSKDVELVSLQYLNSFSKFINNCTVRNRATKTGSEPEVSDTTVYSGAYGISGVWLDLLKSSTIATETANLSMDRFFDFIIDNSYFGASARARMEELAKHDGFFGMLESVTYTRLNNPKLKDKNNINDITSYINEIKDEHIYNPGIELSDEYFSKVKTSFKCEVREMRLGE